MYKYNHIDQTLVNQRVAGDEYVDHALFVNYSASGQPCILSLRTYRANLNLPLMAPKKTARSCFAMTSALS
ncbi:hypothetical protein [Polynucleobacter necessarius]|uniref:hypothetical protein n=1 Tax=Polynucleobacter necessarius TaxID=576610 RepID=UPI001E5BB8D6|nr:hypothetical protein [Polynucleobacter necessarius]